MARSQVLLIGWDAADWKVIQPLLEAGHMPNLARLIADGVHGNLATIYPVLSPMLWTSIATGKRAYKHGIHGFSEPLPDGSGVRPITLLSRKTKAVWNIVNQTGHRSVVVGWWPSHPAEPLNGVMVSNLFQQPTAVPGEPNPLPKGTIHPPALADSLAELRVNPMELTGEFIRLFVPEYEKVDQSKDKRLHMLGKIIAETMSVHAVATELLETQDWDFAAIYYAGIDHFGHGFMRYHPPRLDWIPEQDFEIYQHVVANAYRYHDAMLGKLLSQVSENTTVILMSDHGFHPDHLRPQYIPAEPAGPAVEHRHFGILCMKGPNIHAGRQVFGASVLDICPTLLALLGLARGRDMDGKVLSTAFREPPEPDPIDSWDNVEGDAGLHPPLTRLDPATSAEAFRQLVELGYVSPPAMDVRETIEECTRELKYNLARAYRDGNRGGEAAALAEELWIRWPDEHRFGILLVDCLGALGQVKRRRLAIEELGRRIDLYQTQAKTELDRLEKLPKKDSSADSPADPEVRRAQFIEQRLRELAHGRPLLCEWLLASQALMEDRPDLARPYLEKLVHSEGLSHALRQELASALMNTGQLDSAAGLLHGLLKVDPEDALAHAHLAALHARAGRFEEAIAPATESLSLLYFQPALHALLGRALMETGRFLEAEAELQVAVSQSPRNLAGHDLLARLYRDHLDRPGDAFAHEGRALTLRNELAARQAGQAAPAKPPASAPLITPARKRPARSLASMPQPFNGQISAANVITVVSGLPRSGTSMMMQILAGGGLKVLTDSRRGSDEDNPLGYFEFEKAANLAGDNTWLPQARGKVVKIVSQLLPLLPSNEYYQVILMERDLDEIIASQKAMLVRLGRQGADLNPAQLVEAYSSQLERVLAHLAKMPNVRLLTMEYAALLADSRQGVASLAQFLGCPFDQLAAANCIRPELHRQKTAPVTSSSRITEG